MTALWENGAEKEIVQKELADAKYRDLSFSDGRIFGSMCTEPLEIARDTHSEFIEANLGNAGLYPGTKHLEKLVVGQLCGLLNGTDVSGHIVSGGTEANITALWIARNCCKKNEVVFPKSAHFSFLKACDILSMKPVPVSLTSEYTIDIDEVKRVVGDNTAAVVGVAGTTELGMIDPISELAAVIPDDCFLHVDAAFGGFVIPFLKELGRDVPDFDFSIPEVSSITIDPHKMGMSTIPSGALLIRNPSSVDEIATSAPYLTLDKQTALSGTRCSSAVAATYAAMRTLGREGYRDIVQDCMKVTEHAAKLARNIELELVAEPVMNVLGIFVPGEPRTIQAKMDELGWKVSVAVNPKCLRLVIMPHVTKENVDELFADLERVLAE